MYTPQLPFPTKQCPTLMSQLDSLEEKLENYKKNVVHGCLHQQWGVFDAIAPAPAAAAVAAVA